MGDVVDLRQYRGSKKEEESRTTGIKQAMRDSLDNGEVKRRYRIVTKEKPELEQRLKNIRDSVQRINGLMAELREKNDDKTKV